MNKILICYFSATNTTKNVAKLVKDATNGDLFEIEPVEKYTSSDLDWNNQESRTTLESKDESFRPQIVDKELNLENYDKVVIAFPVWWYKEPNIIDTFIEKYNLENKKIYVFCTSDGSTVEGSFNSLKNKYPNLDFVSGKRLSENLTKDEILSWLM